MQWKHKGHITITQYVHTKQRKLISTKEGIEEYKLHPQTVEAHNGTFKNVYHYDDIPITGLKRVQNLMFAIAAYNLIKLFNLIKEHKLDLYSIISSIKFISMS